MKYLLLFLCLCGDAVAAFTRDYDCWPALTLPPSCAVQGRLLALQAQVWYPAAGLQVSDTAAVPVTGMEAGRREEIRWDSTGNAVYRYAGLASDNRKKAWDSTWTCYYSAQQLEAIVACSNGRHCDSLSLHYRKKGGKDYYLSCDERQRIRYKVTYSYKDDHIFIVRKKDKNNFPVAMARYGFEEDRLSQKWYFDAQLRMWRSYHYTCDTTEKGTRNAGYAVKDSAGNFVEGYAEVRNPAGQLLEQSRFNERREIVSSGSLQYNEQGFVAGEILFLPSGKEVYKYRYEYDDRGNWLRQTVYKNGWLDHMVTRTLSYAGG